MQGKPLNKYSAKIALEYYKSHYTRKEAQGLLGISYSAVVTLYRTFEAQEIEKYDRTQLIPAEAIAAIF